MIKGKMKFADYQHKFVDTIQKLCILSYIMRIEHPAHKDFVSQPEDSDESNA